MGAWKAGFALTLFWAFAIGAEDLVVVVSGVRSLEGNVQGLLWTQPEGFPSESQRADAHAAAAAGAETVKLVFEGVSPGRYAVSVIHDVNDNRELDKNWFGIPKEAVGISNGAIGAFGPGDFEEALFTVDDDHREIAIEFYHW